MCDAENTGICLTPTQGSHQKKISSVVSVYNTVGWGGTLKRPPTNLNNYDVLNGMILVVTVILKVVS